MLFSDGTSKMSDFSLLAALRLLRGKFIDCDMRWTMVKTENAFQSLRIKQQINVMKFFIKFLNFSPRLTEHVKLSDPVVACIDQLFKLYCF